MLVHMELLTLQEATETLRLGETMIYKIIGKGDLPVVRIGRRVLIRRQDLEAFILARLDGVPVCAAGGEQPPATLEGRRVRARRSARS